MSSFLDSTVPKITKNKGLQIKFYEENLAPAIEVYIYDGNIHYWILIISLLIAVFNNWLH